MSLKVVFSHDFSKNIRTGKFTEHGDVTLIGVFPDEKSAVKAYMSDAWELGCELDETNKLLARYNGVPSHRYSIVVASLGDRIDENIFSAK